MKKIATTFMLLFLSIILNGQIHTFDSTAQGWATVGDAPTITHYFSGGNPDGYIRAHDLGNGVTWYWIADSSFLGNKLSSYNNYFRFDMKTTLVNQTTYDDVSITGNGISIFKTLNNPSTAVWSHYDLLINDTSGWKTDSSGITVNAKYTDLQIILDSVSEIKIRGEYSNAVGDYGSLDNVILEPLNLLSPTVNLSSTDSTFCDKQSIDFFDLSTNNPTSWQWYFPGATPDTSTAQNPVGIYYPNAGFYNVTLITCNSFGCDSVTFVNFISEYQPSTPTITQWNDSLFSSPGLSYQWYDLNGAIAGANNNYYDLTLPGTYYAIVTDWNGCDGVSNVIAVTGMDKTNSILSYQIFPSPVNIELTIAFGSIPKEEITVEIFNEKGEKVLANKLFGKSLAIINIEHLKNGLYFLKTNNTKNHEVVKFLKQ